MKYEFNSYQMEVDGHSFWVAESRFLKGCIGQGDTCAEAIAELEENEIEWLESAKKYNIPIPPQSKKTENSYSGKLSLRISPFLHEEASKRAVDLGISLNQYITDAINHYNASTLYTNRSQITETIYTDTGITMNSLIPQKERDLSNIIKFTDYSEQERKQM